MSEMDLTTAEYEIEAVIEIAEGDRCVTGESFHKARDGLAWLLAEVERPRCTHSLSSDGDEGPAAALHKGMPVRWLCTECGERWYCDRALATLRADLDAALATIARVEALHVKWAGEPWPKHRGEFWEGYATQLDLCAQALERALAGAS